MINTVKLLVQPVKPPIPDAKTLRNTAWVAILYPWVAAWVFMLAFEHLHEVWPQIPAFGYWTTLILYIAAVQTRWLVWRAPKDWWPAR